MKPRCSNRKDHALTRTDVLIFVAVLVLLFAMIDFGPSVSEKRKVRQLSCLNNLKQIGMACGDYTDKYPLQASITNGGTMELMNSSEPWRVFQVMSNELSTPKILFCPADKTRTYGTNFDDSLKHHISYFIGVDATDADPQSIVYGDSNFEFHKTTVPPGFFNMVSNNPPQWSSTRHPGSGNFALADGSVQSLTDKSLIQTLTATSLATNRIFIP